MKIVKEQKFEIGYILMLAIIGAGLLGYLFKLPVSTTIMASLILAITFFSFFMLLMIVLEKEQPIKFTQRRVIKKPKVDDFKKDTAQAVNKIIMPKAENQVEAKVKQLTIKPVEQKSDLELFKEAPIQELNKTKNLIIELIDKTQVALRNIDHVFTNRMHKNTKNDIQNFLYLKILNEALSKRLELITDTLDQIELKGKIGLKDSYNLAHGPLEITRDSFSDVNFNDKATELPKEKWQSSVNHTIKSLLRKRTFHQAMQFALLAR